MDMINRSVYLKRPTLDELKYTEKLLACPKTMEFNNKWGGTVAFPKDKWESFFDRYCKGNYYYEYFHIYNLDNVFIGEVSTRFDNKYNSFILNIKIKYEFRGNNHASDALEVFFDYLFKEKGIDFIQDNVAIENTGAIKLLLNIGFKEVDKTSEIVLLRLDKNTWL